MQEFATLRRINQLFSAKLDPAAVMQQILEILQQDCRLALVSVYLLREGEDLLELLAHAGYAIPPGHTFPLETRSLVAGVARSGEAGYYPDVRKVPGYLAGLDTVRSEYVVPLKSRGRLLGVMNCESETLRGFAPRRRELVDQVAAQAAIALAHADVFRRLERSEALYRSLLEFAPDAIWVVSEDLLVTLANPLAAQLFDSSLPQLVGRPLAEVAPADLREELLAAARQVLAGGRAERLLELVRNERQRILELSHFPLRELSGQVFAAATLARDVTERTRNERLKDEFISTVSHELRTPLTSLYTSLTLLDHDSKSGQSALTELLPIALRNVERLVRLTGDILDLKKMEAGVVDYEREEIDLTAVAREAVAAYQPLARDAGLEIRLDGQAGAARVSADAGRLLQVLHNLLSNAVRHSPRGQVLGLSIAKRIVERHGGRLDFTSVPGQATTFFFELPALEP